MGPLTILPLAGIPEVREGDDLGELIARAAEAFHRRVFAMPLGVGTIDWDSLDGTTTVANEAAADRVDALLDGLGTPSR